MRLIKLNASPSVTQLFQQVMQQNLVSKGFRIGQANNANAGVTVDVKEFNAHVDQGNLRYTLNSKIKQLFMYKVHADNTTKPLMRPVHNLVHLMRAYDEIQKVLGETFKDIVNNIYQDQEVTNAN
ncbi:MAG: YajG family lipoprotein [Haemophilus parainfluenzae]